MFRHARAVMAAVVVLAAFSAPVFAGFRGAIFTTTSDGSAVNANLYSSRGDVYINGGPRKAGAAGLPNGFYYVRVTEPNGTVLGSSTFATNQTPVEVVDGEFVQLYRLWSIMRKASDHDAQGFDTTSNNGGQYKVWVSSSSTFTNNTSKTDSFKVQGELTPPEDDPEDPPEEDGGEASMPAQDAMARSLD